MEYCARQKPTNVWSWLGFGISLTILICVWSLNLYLIDLGSQPSNFLDPLGFRIAGIITLTFIFGGIIALIGFIFSIIGLAIASRNDEPKKIGTLGIIFSLLFLPSVFAPVFLINHSSSKPHYESIAKQETSNYNTPDYNTIEDEEILTVSGYNIDSYRTCPETLDQTDSESYLFDGDEECDPDDLL